MTDGLGFRLVVWTNFVGYFIVGYSFFCWWDQVIILYEWWKKIRKKRTQREIWSMERQCITGRQCRLSPTLISSLNVLVNSDWTTIDWIEKPSTLLDKGLSFYKILMKLFHVDLIFMLEIEGEGLPAKIKNSGIPTICLISIHRHSKVSLK